MTSEEYDKLIRSLLGSQLDFDVHDPCHVSVGEVGWKLQADRAVRELKHAVNDAILDVSLKLMNGEFYDIKRADEIDQRA